MPCRQDSHRRFIEGGGRAEAVPGEERWKRKERERWERQKQRGKDAGSGQGSPFKGEHRKCAQEVGDVPCQDPKGRLVQMPEYQHSSLLFIIKR